MRTALSEGWAASTLGARAMTVAFPILAALAAGWVGATLGALLSGCWLLLSWALAALDEASDTIEALIAIIDDNPNPRGTP